MANIPFPFLVDVELNQNELLRAVLHNSATPPTNPKRGQIYYNTGDDKPYYYDGTAWVDFYGGIEQIVAGKGLGLGASSPLGTEAVVTLNVEVDGSSLYIDPDTASGVIKIKPGGVLNTHLATDSVSTIKLQNNSVTFAKMQDVNALTVLGRISGTGDPTEISIVTTVNDDDNTVIPTEGAVFRYVNEQITALGSLVGDWDASVGTFPVTGSGAAGAVAKGDYWYITVAGTLGSGTVVNVGDVLYAKQNAPGQTDANWFVVESNRDQATESTMGVAKIATNAEALAGTNDTNIMTPLKVQAKLNDFYVANGVSVKEFTLSGDDTTVNWICTHNWANLHMDITVSDAATGQRVQTGEDRASSNTAEINFKVAPSTGQSYLVTLMGKDKSIT